MVYKHFVVHPDTVTDAHLASCAAGLQGKFKEFKNLFWVKGFGEYKKTRDPKTMAKDALLAMGKEVGLDMAKFEAEMAGDTCKDRIQSDMNELRKFGVRATPSFYINGKFTMYRGPEQFKADIDKELKEVEASGVAPDQYYQSVVMEKGEKKFKSKVGG